ncbi:hypothetical protein NEUTE1DRAFT_65986 [Neurospora tetrasperma FGSC 2508]|uniref:Peptidase S54 rhomboid domain-containing protein n=1 Tax=Neurospora tetrasperma (strain FGSC 2508 / ATCC MYA-4615 / P0657) TaxID=510951 RepID=F8MNV8_NEUT8|nr:uncharacterized protein NEUTE1DRAFT_65986 [Neurospora tetrasperma FGSC 2508]EGO57023.1 hypothetical protein NEUTE1DRAFT_65986 [Neurospora tetrasperma FGSC 2508]EGZ70070.1 hypothetical protein NEUTE2DRAFT_112549 [Neurospora tetrasperma FGSC 2509]
MSFTDAPVTKALVLGLVGLSIAASVFDIKHYFYISIGTHFLRYGQLWRMLTYQLCYTNSSEVLFGAMSLYHTRMVERFWGSRKYASFILLAGLFTAIIPPIFLTVVLRPLSFGVLDYIPAGPTPILFAILAQYHAMIPQIYKYKVALSANSPSNASDDTSGFIFSDKSTRYLMALQLALFQWPGSLLGAVIGWAVGYLWRNDLLPAAVARWRVPGWVVGLRAQKRNDRFDGIRRRLEDEGASTGVATGAQPAAEGEGNRRRPLGQQLIDEVRGAF